ncbi:hypothetical protein ACF0H5_019729 [Mactra antiquata]
MDLRILLVSLCIITPVSSIGVKVLDGDIYILFVGALYLDSNIDGTCNTIEVETVQNMMSIKWTLSQLNEQNFIPGIRIGLLVAQTCQRPDADKKIALKVAAELQSNTGSKIIAIIGPDYSSETESISRLLSSLPQEYRLLQVGFSSTSTSLRDRTLYNNFFRTIPADEVQVKTMSSFISKLDWTYIAIIYSDDAYGQGGKDALLEETAGLDVCFPVRVAIPAGQNTASNLEQIIDEQILRADIPISGILVFGNFLLSENTLKATEAILERETNLDPPVFLFSEAGHTIVGKYANASRGAYVLSPRRKIMSKFQTYWRSLFTGANSFDNLYAENLTANTWLRDLYNVAFNCSLPTDRSANTCPNLSLQTVTEGVAPSVYNQYAIQAALVTANVTKQVLSGVCSPGALCNQFLDTSITKRSVFIERLQSFPVKFDDDFNNFRLPEFQDPDLVIEYNGTCEAVLPTDFPLYEVYNQQYIGMSDTLQLIKVADYSLDNGLTVYTQDIKDYDSNGNVLNWQEIRRPQCPDGKFCSKCWDHSIDHSVLFYPGDMYIVGIVPVHGNGDTPLNCGNIKLGGVDIVETIRFAVDEANVKPNADIGVIIIDSCNDAQLIQEKILTLQRFGVLIDGQYIPVRDKIIGYVGAWSSDVSRAVSEIVSRLGHVQISYASTATLLSSRDLYPYFLRIPSTDYQQAEVLLKITKEFDANLVQILYSESEYGKGGKNTLLDLIESTYREVCVSQVVPVSTLSDPSAVVAEIRKAPNAKIILAFLGSFEVTHIISELNTLTRNEFLIIVSEGWGTRFDVSMYPSLLGTITVSSELVINEKVKDHMKSLSPSRNEIDPWIRDYIEAEFDCYFEWSYNKTSLQPCRGDERLDVYGSSYRIDTWSPFAERAVIALLASARNVLIAKCGGSTSLCDDFRSNPQALYDELKQYRYQEDTQFIRLFDNNGDGTAGYTLYTVTLDQTGHYRKIGVQQQEAFTFQKDLYNSIRGEQINSTCSAEIPECAVCFPKPTLIAESKQGVDTGVIAVIVVLGICCCILAAVLLFICNRVGCCCVLDNGRVKLANPYLTPTYISDRRLHSIDGSDGNHGDMVRYDGDNYDSIPNSSVSYQRSNSNFSGGRVPHYEGSVSSNEKGRSDGSTQSGISRMNSNLDGSVSGHDNRGFDSGQRYAPINDRNRISTPSSIQSYMEPSPALPLQRTVGSGSDIQASNNVVFQPDGSYITASDATRQDTAESQISSGSQTDIELQQMSADSDKSVGYLGRVKLAE